MKRARRVQVTAEFKIPNSKTSGKLGGGSDWTSGASTGLVAVAVTRTAEVGICFSGIGAPSMRDSWALVEVSVAEAVSD